MPARDTPTRDLTTSPWPDVAQPTALVVIPVGSCEQHGPHLPFTVDSVIAAAVAHAFAARATATSMAIAPTLHFGSSGEHQAFAGTLSIGQDALYAVLLELGRSATTWARKVLFVNGHGGNREALVLATNALRTEGRDVAWWPVGVPGGDAHAGRTETSLLLAIDQTRVSMAAAAPGQLAPLADIMPLMRTTGTHAVSESGVLGDPTGATAGEGRVLLADLAERLCNDIAHWQLDATSGRLLDAESDSTATIASRSVGR